MMDKTPAQKAYFALLAKSYLEEQKDMMISILEYTPELDAHIDISGLESGEWSYDDREWRLENGTTFDSIAKLLFLSPVSFTKALLKAPFLSLYDCIFLVGEINGNFGIVNEAMDIAYMALTKKIVSPRDPDTYLKCADLPPITLSLKAKIPDLSWVLSFEEAEAWAVNSFGLSFKEYRDKLENEQQNNPPKSETLTTNTKPTKPTLEDGRPEDAINTLLKMVLGMAIDAYRYDPDAKKNKATGDNNGSITAALAKIDGLKTDSGTIKKYLDEAANRFPNAKPRKP